MAPWPTGARADPPSPPPPARSAHAQKEAQSALAAARQKLQSATTADLPESCITILQEQVRQEEEAMKRARPLGQKLDQARAGFKRAVKAGEKALKNVGKAQKIFAAAQEEVVQAQMDLEKLDGGAPMPILAGPQVNVSLFKTLDSLTGAVERLWSPDAGQPPEHLVRLIQESRALVQASSVVFTQRAAAVRKRDARTWRLKANTWPTPKKRMRQADRGASKGHLASESRSEPNVGS